MIRNRMRWFVGAGFGAALLLGACAGIIPAGVVTTVQADQAAIQAKIVEGCGIANTAAAGVSMTPLAAIPQVAGVLTFITGSCVGAQAIAALTTKAVNDPSTIAWLTGLPVTLRAAVAQVRGG